LVHLIAPNVRLNPKGDFYRTRSETKWQLGNRSVDQKKRGRFRHSTEPNFANQYSIMRKAFAALLGANAF
jgi:hypothetical protein